MGDQSPTSRAFFALSLDPAQRNALASCSGALGREPWATTIRWVAAANLHLTLRFLGEVPRPALDALATRVKADTRSCDPFVLELSQIGFFPDPRRPRIVAALVEAIPALVDLVRRIETAVVDQGLPGDDHTFRPHITLGRIRRQNATLPADLPPQAVAPPLTVAGFDLYQSTLKPSGAVYRVLQHFPFAD